MPARGSIERKEGIRGVTYRARLTIGERPDGSRIVESRTFNQRKLAAAWLNELSQAVQGGTYARATPLTLCELCERWLSLPNPRWCASTRRRYRLALQGQVLPWLGGVRVARLTTLMLQDHFDGRAAQGAGPAGLGVAKRALGGALKQAVAWQLIAQNPISGVVIAGTKGPERGTWTAQQATAFLRATQDDHPWGAIWTLLAFTGLRESELLVLEWGDVDLERATLSVRRHMSRDVHNRQIILPGAKSAAGRRTIGLTLPAVVALRKQCERVTALREAHRAIWSEVDGDLIFPNGEGRMLSQYALGKRFDRAVARSGLPRITPHDLRHTRATHLLEAGVQLKIVSAVLGHASVGITADRYQHVTPEIHAGVTGPLERQMAEVDDDDVSAG